MSLKKKRMELDLAKCRMAKMEYEYKIEETKAQIDRLNNEIKLQDNREEELLESLKELKE